MNGTVERTFGLLRVVAKSHTFTKLCLGLKIILELKLEVNESVKWIRADNDFQHL
jgi:hypothetical protein